MPIPIIVGGGTDDGAAGTPLPDLVDRLAETLGYYGTGTVTTEAASLEAESWVISNQFQSDQAPPESVDGLFLFVRDGDVTPRTQRRLVNGSFDGPYGALRVDRPYAAALAEGTAFEVSVLPREKHQGVEGLRHILNLALEQLPVIDDVSVTVTATDGVTDSEYSLAGYSWPIKAVTGVVYPRTSMTSEARRQVPRGRWVFENDAQSPVLSFRGGAPGNVGDVFEVQLHRPASSWIKRNGVWADSTAGLVYETDACLYDAATVARVARPIALQRLGLLHEQGSPKRLSLLAESLAEERRATLARFYGRFKGSGAQRLGAVGRR